MSPKVISAAVTSRRVRARGFVLSEMMFGLGIAAVLIMVAAGVYSTMKTGVNADDMAQKTIGMVTDIQQNWRSAGNFSSVSAAELNKIALIKDPIKFATPNAVDAFGNNMAINGSATTFAITIGGATNPMDKDQCATIANKLATIATNINIGGAATAAAGVVSGGNAFKVGATVTQGSLTTGCSEASPVIAAQFR